jgi:F0F1-type ATP synthase assembly protein I
MQGFGDALAHAVELVLTTVIFVLGGHWLDSKLGTSPLFMVILGALVITGLGVIEYYRYQAKIARVEEGKPWTRSTRR